LEIGFGAGRGGAIGPIAGEPLPDQRDADRNERRGRLFARGRDHLHGQRPPAIGRSRERLDEDLGAVEPGDQTRQGRIARLAGDARKLEPGKARPTTVGKNDIEVW